MSEITLNLICVCQLIFLVLSRDVDQVVFAIRRGDVGAINDLATSTPHSLMKENNDGWIPLHDAAFCGQTECLKILLRGMTEICSICKGNILLDVFKEGF